MTIEPVAHTDPKTAAIQKVAELINPASENKISANTLFKATIIVDEVLKRFPDATIKARTDRAPAPR